jgi:hypothetical protein
LGVLFEYLKMHRTTNPKYMIWVLHPVLRTGPMRREDSTFNFEFPVGILKSKVVPKP